MLLEDVHASLYCMAVLRIKSGRIQLLSTIQVGMVFLLYR